MLRKTRDSDFLESGTISLVVFYVLVANMFLFFVLGVFFDGGAFPWGQTDGERFWIDNNDGRREVSAEWFQFTFWQGITAWAGIGLFFAASSSWGLVRNVWNRKFREAFKYMLVLTACAAWTIFISLMAVDIAAKT